MSEDREPIIDALLEELLGGEQPPDLTQRILNAYDESTDSSIDVRIGKTTSAQWPTQGPTLKDDAPSPRQKPREPSPRRKSNWQNWASVAIVLVAATGFAFWASDFADRFGPNGPVITVDHNPAPQPPIIIPDGPDLAGTYPDQETIAQPSDVENETPSVDSIANKSNGEEELQPPEPVEFRRTLELQARSSDQRVIASVNSRLATQWVKTYKPTPAVDDKTWFRRASRFLIGRVLPPRLENNWLRNADKQVAVETLMGTDAFRERWATFLSTVLVGDEDSNNVDVDQLRAYLVQSIKENKPYDQLAFELITAEGSNKPGDDDFNPATNFLLGNQQIEWIADKPKDAHRIGATEKVGQVFLGKQLQCARCHDHEGIAQTQYYEMMAFFAQMRPDNAKEKGATSRITNVDLVSETDAKTTDADLYYADAAGNGTSAYPRFLDGQELTTQSGRIRDINRRKALADMIVATEDFSSAFVNRLWDEALGAGFTRPIDDMGLHNPPSHPELLEDLATEFRNSEFDMKAVMKWIVMSQAFNRASRPTTHQLVGRPDAFSSFARQDPTLVYPSVGWTLAQFAKAARADGQFDPRTTLGNLAEGEKKKAKSSPQQKARELAHVNAKTQFIKDAYGTLIRKLARNDQMTDRQRVVHMFLATVGRIPNDYERKHGVNILKHSRSVESGLEDVGVVLLNSKEFITQH